MSRVTRWMMKERWRLRADPRNRQHTQEHARVRRACGCPIPLQADLVQQRSVISADLCYSEEASVVSVASFSLFRVCISNRKLGQAEVNCLETILCSAVHLTYCRCAGGGSQIPCNVYDQPTRITKLTADGWWSLPPCVPASLEPQSNCSGHGRRRVIYVTGPC